MPAELPRRKPRPKPAPYAWKPQAEGQCRDRKAPVAAISGKPIKSNKRKNLTLHHWLTVFSFIDSHPNVSQESVVEHFKTLQEGALEFTQSTLSRKLRDRAKLEKRKESHPNALSGKRPRVVTDPEVEKALILWVRSMEEKGETVSGRVLREKRKEFEDQFEVSEESRLTGDGWITSFCKAYRIKGYRRHVGGAEPVSVEGVAAECTPFQENTFEIDSEDEERTQPTTPISCSEIIQLCRRLETACLTQIDVDTSLELTRQLRKFRGAMRRKELQSEKQTTLNMCK